MKIINPYRFASASGTLLLDETGIGSAHVAFSVARKLRAAYSGSAIRVRRTSDNTQQDIGFSGDALDTGSLETFCSGTDGYVVTIYDQSGNAQDATMATEATQSQIVASGVINTTNGKPSLLNTSDRYHAEGGAISAITAASMYAVAQSGAADGADYLKHSLFFGSNGGRTSVGVGWGTYADATSPRKPASEMSGEANPGSGQCLAAAATTNQVLTIFIANGTARSFYLNDGSEISNTGGATVSITNGDVQIMSRATSYLQIDGTWQEGVAWQSDVEAYVETIKSNVNAFYGIY